MTVNFIGRHALSPARDRRRRQHLERAARSGLPREAGRVRRGPRRSMPARRSRRRAARVERRRAGRRDRRHRRPVSPSTTASAWPATFADHRRRRARGRLGDGHPPPLAGRRAREHPGPPVEVDLLGFVDPPGQADPAVGARGVDLRLELFALVALADDHGCERGMVGLSATERVDQHVELLHRHQPAHRHHQRGRRLLRRRACSAGRCRARPRSPVRA